MGKPMPVGTARCGPACRVVWDLPLIDLTVSQRWGPDWRSILSVLSNFRNALLEERLKVLFAARIKCFNQREYGVAQMVKDLLVPSLLLYDHRNRIYDPVELALNHEWNVQFLSFSVKWIQSSCCFFVIFHIFNSFANVKRRYATSDF
jgi:hypothetical protein